MSWQGDIASILLASPDRLGLGWCRSKLEDYTIQNTHCSCKNRPMSGAWGLAIVGHAVLMWSDDEVCRDVLMVRSERRTMLVSSLGNRISNKTRQGNPTFLQSYPLLDTLSYAYLTMNGESIYWQQVELQLPQQVRSYHQRQQLGNEKTRSYCTGDQVLYCPGISWDVRSCVLHSSCGALRMTLSLRSCTDHAEVEAFVDSPLLDKLISRELILWGMMDHTLLYFTI